jgi:glycosyltransferase involved in cell wall biosynthesis
MSFTDLAACTLIVVGIVLALPVVVLFLEIAASCFARPTRPLSVASRPSLAVLIPAHNEALGIASTVEGIRHQLLPGDRILVVADNCTDATADLAERAKADVVERIDPIHRGKAFALDYGLKKLAMKPVHEIVVVVDADCRLSANCLDILASKAAATGRPVQAQYRLDPPSEAVSPYLQVATLAFVVKSRARPLGLASLGGPCQLQGTGMGFPWSIMR